MSCSPIFVGIFCCPRLHWSVNFFRALSWLLHCHQRCQGWIFTATKITTYVGSSTSDLRLRHKTYHWEIFNRSTQSSWNHHHLTIHALLHADQRFSSFSTRLMCHKYCFDDLTAAVIGIVFLWSTSPEKNRPHRTLHTPSRVDQSSREDWIMCLTHSTRRWSPADVIANVIITMSALADVFSLHHLADVIIVVDHWLWLCCWPLTFSQSWLFAVQVLLAQFLA